MLVWKSLDKQSRDYSESLRGHADLGVHVFYICTRAMKETIDGHKLKKNITPIKHQIKSPRALRTTKHCESIEYDSEPSTLVGEYVIIAAFEFVRRGKPGWGGVRNVQDGRIPGA